MTQFFVVEQSKLIARSGVLAVLNIYQMNVYWMGADSEGVAYGLGHFCAF